LHWVFKVADLEKSVAFFEKVIGLKVLRHEEFEKECDATCNGPYVGSWSKTMMGPGDEHDNFVIELTYNYGVTSYKVGNDLRHISVRAGDVAKRAAENNVKVHSGSEGSYLVCPDGHKFLLEKNESAKQLLFEVSLNSADVGKSKDYWNGVLGLSVVAEDNGKSVTVAYAEDQTRLQFVQLPSGEKLDHGEAFGRIAFDCDSVAPIETAVKKSKDVIQVGPLKLDTPNKATVEVIITQDRDGYEICHVERIGFASLCNVKEGDDKIDWEERAGKLKSIARWAEKRKKKAAEEAAKAAAAAK